jgi:activating signal cointegrator complex subunit 2
VGGTVDSAGGAAPPREDDPSAVNEEALYRAYRLDRALFRRDAETRRGSARAALRLETDMTDEAVEGWAVMLERDPRLAKRLDAKYSGWAGAQTELRSTAWRAGSGGEEEEESADGSGPSFRGGRGRGRGRGGGGRGGGRGGNVAGPTGEKETEAARRRKEANKGSRANHNRRDQRARKMARGGFPG